MEEKLDTDAAGLACGTCEGAWLIVASRGKEAGPLWGGEGYRYAPKSSP